MPNGERYVVNWDEPWTIDNEASEALLQKMNAHWNHLCSTTDQETLRKKYPEYDQAFYDGYDLTMEEIWRQYQKIKNTENFTETYPEYDIVDKYFTSIEQTRQKAMSIDDNLRLNFTQDSIVNKPKESETKMDPFTFKQMSRDAIATGATLGLAVNKVVTGLFNKDDPGTDFVSAKKHDWTKTGESKIPMPDIVKQRLQKYETQKPEDITKKRIAELAGLGSFATDNNKGIALER